MYLIIPVTPVFLLRKNHILLRENSHCRAGWWQIYWAIFLLWCQGENIGEGGYGVVLERADFLFDFMKYRIYDLILIVLIVKLKVCTESDIYSRFLDTFQYQN